MLAALTQSDHHRRLSHAERQLIGRRRLAHNVIEALPQIADADGNIGSPFSVLSTLAAMQRSGSITAAQRGAGDEFHRLFRLANLDGLKAADLGRVSTSLNAAASVCGNERARRQIARTITLLGGELAVTASCAWHVLGLEWSLRAWAAKSLRGNHMQASGILIATLGILEPHFSA